MLNWMLYFRGHSKDFDEWEDLGNPGWGWRNVQAFFKKAEKFAGSNEDRTYGTEGRFWVMPMPHVHKVISLLHDSIDYIVRCWDSIKQVGQSDAFARVLALSVLWTILLFVVVFIDCCIH